MATSITSFLLVLLLLSSATARPLSTFLTTTWAESDHLHMPPSPNPTLLSPEESGMDTDDGCRGLESEECLIRRSMVAHTDYIYTQDISEP
ncbi:phytosulfokines 3-like [Juglans microcarpa x Juglans regia]|uniref:phytosulfokines 3-like n=1 Tax=Juglans microcarpa x Juglans regia TaxID=2249226 RepID=UPI001B7E9DE9|nr:phytosulfokines 3-like [Juglans microcarpa x Juglans regia]